MNVSEQGWQQFHKAEDLPDWVVLHGGPTAVFHTKSLADAARLAAAITQLDELNNSNAHISLVSSALTIRLTREVWKTESRHIELAREISKIAKQHGAIAEPHRVQEVQIAIAAKPDAMNLEFWRAILGYEPMQEDNAVDPLATGSTVWMQEIDQKKSLKHAMHIDVSVSKDQAELRLAKALAAGGVVIDDSEAPGFWILADASGNKVCLVAWPDGAK